MNPNDYFEIAQFIAATKQEKIPSEILFRTAINRLYYGIFHLVQVHFNILIPKSEITRCHAFVKENIEQTNIVGDYAELETYRVDADYQLSKRINENHYKDALRIKERIFDRMKITDEYVPYEADDEFFFKYKKIK